MNFICFMNNNINILDEFADDVTEINISHKNIKGPLDFKRFTKLIKLDCNCNKITSLDNLPNSIIKLRCYNNKITSLNNLSNSLIELHCYNNEIISLYNLPNSLIKFDCDNTVKDYKILIKKYNK